MIHLEAVKFLMPFWS